MAEILLHIQVASGVELEKTAQCIEERLSQLELVEEAEAEPEQARITGVEVAAMIAAAVVLVRSSRELIEEVRKLIPQIRGLIHDIQVVRAVFVEVGKERVAVDQLSDAHLQVLAHD
jgi:hypothetical protein